MIAARHASSHQAKRSRVGNAAERLIEAQHKALALAGIAFIYRVPTPIAITCHGEHLEAVHNKRATVDYLGHMADGRVVATETKHLAPRRAATGGELPASLPRSRVEPHQALALERAARSGGVAVVLVIYDNGRELYAVPWAVARDDGGLRSLARWRVRQGRLYLPIAERG